MKMCVCVGPYLGSPLERFKIFCSRRGDEADTTMHGWSTVRLLTSSATCGYSFCEIALDDRFECELDPWNQISNTFVVSSPNWLMTRTAIFWPGFAGNGWLVWP